MEYLGRKMLCMTKYKRTALYLLAVAVLILLVSVANADASTSGRIKFKVGSEQVERIVRPNSGADRVMMIRVYINGKQVETGEEQGCNVFFHRAWVTVRAHSCESDATIKLTAVNNGNKAKRVKFTWKDYGPVHKRTRTTK